MRLDKLFFLQRLSPEGRIVPSNTPWAQAHQFWSDVSAAGELESMRSWYADLDGDVRRVLVGPFAEQFLEWDASELRASATSRDEKERQRHL